MRDSLNGIVHQCPCCKYESSYDYKEDRFLKGDESFIRIKSVFETDKPRVYGEYEKVLLLGCPKCGTVSYVIW